VAEVAVMVVATEVVAVEIAAVAQIEVDLEVATEEVVASSFCNRN
jgi:hypothetical protein